MALPCMWELTCIVGGIFCQQTFKVRTSFIVNDGFVKDMVQLLSLKSNSYNVTILNETSFTVLSLVTFSSSSALIIITKWNLDILFYSSDSQIQLVIMLSKYIVNKSIRQKLCVHKINGQKSWVKFAFVRLYFKLHMHAPSLHPTNNIGCLYPECFESFDIV